MWVFFLNVPQSRNVPQYPGYQDTYVFPTLDESRIKGEGLRMQRASRGQKTITQQTITNTSEIFSVLLGVKNVGISPQYVPVCPAPTTIVYSMNNTGAPTASKHWFRYFLEFLHPFQKLFFHSRFSQQIVSASSIFVNHISLRPQIMICL